MTEPTTEPTTEQPSPGPEVATFSLADRARSFRYAFSGIGYMLRSQHLSLIHI